MWASRFAAFVLLTLVGSCSEDEASSEKADVDVASQRLTAANRAPERAIAVVLDTSSNLAPHCFEDRNTAKFVPSTDAPQGLFAGMTQTICDDIPRWPHQRDGLVQALRTSVPLDGSVAVTVVADALHQVDRSFGGPRVVVPYTVIRTAADRKSVIQTLSQLDLSVDQPTTDYTYSWKGSTCRGSYDSVADKCYSPASHAWAAHEACFSSRSVPERANSPRSRVRGRLAARRTRQRA